MQLKLITKSMFIQNKRNVVHEMNRDNNFLPRWWYSPIKWSHKIIDFKMSTDKHKCSIFETTSNDRISQI